MMINPDLPPSAGIDFNNIGGWLAGLATIGALIYAAVNRALKQAKEIVSSPPVQQTSVITTDTVAMHELAASMEANTAAMIENNVLHRQILGEVRDYLKELREDRIEAEIIKKIKDDLKLEGLPGDRAPRPRRRSETGE